MSSDFYLRRNLDTSLLLNLNSFFHNFMTKGKRKERKNRRFNVQSLKLFL